MRRAWAVLFMAVLWMPAAAQTESPILGTWVTALKTEITIASCQTGYCGYLTTIVIPEERYQANKEAIDAIGIENLTDYNNPDPALRTRTLLGMPILNLNRQISPGMFEGEIYNPEDGQNYFGRLELIDADTVRLVGCAFLILCQSEDWVRATQEDADQEAPPHSAKVPLPVPEPVPLPTPEPTPASEPLPLL